MDHKEELEKKRLKLAELKRQREERKTTFQKTVEVRYSKRAPALSASLSPSPSLSLFSLFSLSLSLFSLCLFLNTLDPRWSIAFPSASARFPRSRSSAPSLFC